MLEDISNVMTEKELEGVSGGVIAGAGSGDTNSQDKTGAYEKHICKCCNKETVFICYSGGFRKVCKDCGNALDEQIT